MPACVVRTGISEMHDTAVVLPTPKPPAMTIFTGSGGRRQTGEGASGCSGSPDPPDMSVDGVKPTDDPFDDGGVAVQAAIGVVGGEVPATDQVADEDPDHAEVQAEAGGDPHDRQRLTVH